jgi:hypothetical protein
MSLKPSSVAGIVFVIPVGPGANPDSVLDTVDSIRHNTLDSGVIVGVEVGSEIRSRLEPHASDFTIVEVPLPKQGGASTYNTRGKLFLKTGRLLREALRLCKADVFVKIDDDALMIRPGFEEDVRQLLARNPRCGAFGTVKWGFRSPVRRYPRRRGIFESTVMWLRDPAIARAVSPLVFGALLKGAPLGVNVSGMCSGHTRPCLEAMERLGIFDHDALMRSMSQEDMLLSAAAVKLGFELCDFPIEGNPLGFHWKHLPASPEVLWEAGVKIVHSVRDQEYGTEAQIRKYFREKGGRG